MKRSDLSLLACAMLLCAITGRAQADLITATHLMPADPDTWFNDIAGMSMDGTVYDNRLGQSFTTTIGGQLSTISFVASRLSSTNVDLRLSLASFEDGQPGEVLASTLIDLESFHVGFLPGLPQDFTHTIDFSGAGVTLEQDQMYAILFMTDTVEANYRIYGDYEGYNGGHRLFSQNGSPYEQLNGDLFFEVTVLIPAPSALAMLVVVVAGSRRRPR